MFSTVWSGTVFRHLGMYKHPNHVTISGGGIYVCALV